MRGRSTILMLIAILISACNLSNEPEGALPTRSPVPRNTTEGEVAAISTEVLPQTPLPTPALTPININPVPSLLPLPNATTLGGLCDVYTTYSGTSAANVLSMRAEPSSESTQLVRVPNNTPVYRVPESTEVEAEGYHWLNVIYTDSRQNRYQGWIARDSFIQDGVRDPSISTLRSTGQQAPC